MALPQHGHSGIVSLGRILGPCLLEMLIDIELHDRAGKVLGQAVVDFVGDQLPFVVAGLQQVPEGAMFPLQGFLGLLAFGNVGDHDCQTRRLPALVTDQERIGEDVPLPSLSMSDRRLARPMSFSKNRGNDFVSQPYSDGFGVRGDQASCPRPHAGFEAPSGR